jgi:hypothetical protein
VKNLGNGCILTGKPGSGKSVVALQYYVDRVLGVRHPADLSRRLAEGPRLVIITTARKRDDLDWQRDVAMYGLTHYTTVDSWNNISNYSNIRDSFIIFDEQRAIGNGKWAKTFVKMARNNEWIMLSGTPGDNWLDYCPVFVANGFFKNRTQFEREHCQFNYRAGYPRLERYLGQGKLLRLRNRILVDMPFVKKTIKKRTDVPVPYEEKPYRTIQKYRFDPYKEEPIKNAGGLCHVLRRVTNEDPVRLEAVRGLCEVHPRVIVFYNFDYELFMLRSLRDILGISVAEYNGHKHDPLPEGPRWVYLVQYTAGAEAWNCTTCDTMIFFSQNYSWRVMEQCEGRIDRLNTPYSVLNYYYLKSQSPIDQAISRAIRVKEIFNERGFYDSLS